MGAYNYEPFFARVFGEREFGKWLYNGPIPCSGKMDLVRLGGPVLSSSIVLKIWQNEGHMGGPIQNVMFSFSCPGETICENKHRGNTIAYFENEEEGRVKCTDVSFSVEYALKVPSHLPNAAESVQVVRATFSTDDN